MLAEGFHGSRLRGATRGLSRRFAQQGMLRGRFWPNANRPSSNTGIHASVVLLATTAVNHAVMMVCTKSMCAT